MDDILSEDYVPRDEDIIRARNITRGMDKISFKQGVSINLHNKKVLFKYLLKFQSLSINLIDVGGQRPERKKWFLLFKNIEALIFVASMSDFDQVRSLCLRRITLVQILKNRAKIMIFGLFSLKYFISKYMRDCKNFMSPPFSMTL